MPPQWSSILALVGALLLAHAYNRKNYIRNILAKGEETEGRVVEIRRNPGGLFSSKGGPGEAPVVAYTTVSGNTLRHYSITYVSPCKYRVGQPVRIWYINYKSRREAALPDDQPGSLPRNLFIAGLICFALGAPALISGLMGLF
ncbi:MAG TPA: DUF3592 domain-containing protein [Flavilitoribacter sp.]|nr:DUF3592 domain-containing protein [Flavilitoribacter sp.]HMQ89854.1 DUF3592 domain-containing protein [Flavilitoribacter sp.]